MLALLAVLALSSDTALSNSLSIPLPEATSVAHDCDTPILDRLNIAADQMGDACVELEMSTYPQVMAAFHNWFTQNEWSLGSQERSLSTYINQSPPRGCQQQVIVMLAPPRTGLSPSTAPGVRPWDGNGYILFMPMYSEGCEL